MRVNSVERLETEYGVFTNNIESNQTAQEVYEEWLANKDNPPLPTLEEQLAEKDAQILKLKEEQFKTQQMTTQNTEAQQELIELLMMMGVI